MPHSTTTTLERLSSSSGRSEVPASFGLHRLPAYEDGGMQGRLSPRSTSPNKTNNETGFLPKWYPRKESKGAWGNGDANGVLPKHGRQRSLSEAIKHIQTRRGSVSANAHEIADALKAPVSPMLIILCIVWYLTSALTNTSSKTILNAFKKPVTLTLIQFLFVSGWCGLFAYLAHVYPSLKKAIPALKHGIRYPTQEVLMTTLPLAVFQVGGHLLSSTATSKIPVSLVHTIKGMSPLFTVLAYRFVFRVHYSPATYLSLIPLTLGVMLACSAEFHGNIFGILCASGAAIIFVTQNIFSKRLFNEAARAEADGTHAVSRKLDKLNLLCYSSGVAFLLTCPLWLWSEGLPLLTDFLADGALDLSHSKHPLTPGRLALEFIFNGVTHFGQNIMAFILLSRVSPVTYSVASLVKRIFVIVVAIVWFGNNTTNVQAMGIALTFLGLYLYDRTSDATKTDRRAELRQMKGENTLLPLVTNMSSKPSYGFVASPLSGASGQTSDRPNGYAFNVNERKVEATGTRKPGLINHNNAAASWLLPGTRAEETWRPTDVAVGSGVTVS